MPDTFGNKNSNRKKSTDFGSNNVNINFPFFYSGDSDIF